MQNKTRPLYGSFNFGKEIDILALISRMQQVSAHFLEERIFNSYLKTAAGHSHYGLDYEELADLFQVHQGLIQTITSSSSTLAGKGVNINIRFAKGEKEGEGQFVIVAGSKGENEEIRDMLLGKWQEKTPEAEEQAQFEEAAKHQETAPLLEALQSVLPPEEVVVQKQFPTKRKVFFYNHALDTHELVDKLYDLFIQFMDDATFDIRLLSWKGDLQLGIQVENLRDFLLQAKDNIQKLYVLLETRDGRFVDLVFSFAPLPHIADSEVKIKSSNADAILQFIEHEFSIDAQQASARALPFKLGFSFVPATFEIEHLLFIIEGLLQKEFSGAQASAFISTKEGLLYHDQPIDKLKDLFYLHQKKIQVLSIYIHRPLTSQSANLVFEFSTHTGNMALQLGNTALQERMSHVIWERLSLQLPEEAQPQEQALPEKPHTRESIFESKLTEVNPNLCLLVFPEKPQVPEAMLSELTHALEMIGLEVLPGESIFGYLVMEKLWQKLNKASIVIADVSSKSAAVFYALGIAHTLGKNVILLTQNPSDIPFDFKKFPHIIYESNEAGYLNLRQELLAYLKKS